jgi:hypothetical protein
MKEQLARIRTAFEKVSIHSDATAHHLSAYPLNEGFKALIELERMLADRPEQAPCVHSVNSLGHCTRCGARPHDCRPERAPLSPGVALATTLPVDEADERIVDEMMARQARERVPQGAPVLRCNCDFHEGGWGQHRSTCPQYEVPEHVPLDNSEQEQGRTADTTKPKGPR